MKITDYGTLEGFLSRFPENMAFSILATSDTACLISTFSWMSWINVLFFTYSHGSDLFCLYYDCKEEL